MLLLLLWVASVGETPVAYATHGVDHATIRTWALTAGAAINGFDPHETIDDVTGLTNHVGAPAMVTSMENVCGGSCGILYWNPVTNNFKAYCITGGFQFAGDMDRRAPAATPGNFGGGDFWVMVNGGSSFSPYMNFRGTNNLRRWDLGNFNATGIRVHATNGKVYMGNASGEIIELDPATNGVRRWATTSLPYELRLDSTHVWATATAGGAQPDQILRLNPATNELVRWNVPGASNFTTCCPFGTPNSINKDADGNIWFTETASDQLARLRPGPNGTLGDADDIIDEFTKLGMDEPESISTSGSGATLQGYFTEGSSAPGHISLINVAGATPTSTTVPAAVSTVMPTSMTAAPVSFTSTPVTSVITPVTTDLPGINSGGIIRFPVPAGTTRPTGMTPAVYQSTVYGSMEGNEHVFQLGSLAITAPPIVPGPPPGVAPGEGCPHHRIHGHLDTVPVNHSGASNSHLYGHTVHDHRLGPGAANCIPHVPGHSAGLMPDPGEGLFTALRALEPPDFTAALNREGGLGWAHRGGFVQLFGSARGLWVGPDERQPAETFLAPPSGVPLYHTTLTPEVRVGNVKARVLFSGMAPGLMGAWQINFLVPSDAPLGKVPVRIVYDGDELRAVDLVVNR